MDCCSFTIGLETGFKRLNSPKPAVSPTQPTSSLHAKLSSQCKTWPQDFVVLQANDDTMKGAMYGQLWPFQAPQISGSRFQAFQVYPHLCFFFKPDILLPELYHLFFGLVGRYMYKHIHIYAYVYYIILLYIALKNAMPRVNCSWLMSDIQ